MKTSTRILVDLSRRPARLPWMAWLGAMLWLVCPATAFAEDPVLASAAVTNAADLRARLSAYLDRPLFSTAEWGVKVVSLDTGATVFERNPQKPLIPASNTKLFTAALVLDRLGPNYRIRTSLLARKEADRRGRVVGDLVLYGRGDPSLSSFYPSGNLSASLGRLAESLARSGVRSVRGEVIADESYFLGPPFGSGWAIEDLDSYYSPEVSALSLQDNVAEWVVLPGRRVGSPASLVFSTPVSPLTAQNHLLTSAEGTPASLQSERLLGQNVLRVWGDVPLGVLPLTNVVTVHRPAEWFGQLFRAAAIQRGIRIEGGVHTLDGFERAPAPLRTNDWTELGSIESPPMSELVQAMMKPSNNLYAQLLFLQVGALGSAQNALINTEGRAVEAMRRFLKAILVGHPEPHLEEGAGLSRRNAVCAESIVTLLKYMDHHPASGVYKDSMPVAGVDGTLRGRMRHTAAENNLRGKTGTLRGVNSLSGYVTTATGERLAFSILLNQYVSTDPKRPARDELDGLAIMLAEFQGVSR